VTSRGSGPDAALAGAWAALGGGAPPAEVRFDGVPPLPARLPVPDLAAATVAACALAAVELAGARGRVAAGPVVVDGARVGTAFIGERHLRVAGRTFEAFAPLSGFFPAADGWVRTHANYPHHLAALRAALGDGVPAAIRALPALEVEERVAAAGGLAVAVRTPEQWTAHPQGRVVADLPLVGWLGLDTAVRPPPRLPAGGPPGPAAGVRVLDLTRVIAGPVATRTLALLGADVLRVDPPRLPEIEAQHLETGPGKRSTLLDLARASDRRTFEDLLAAAHVVVTGYRPGALDGSGLAPAALAQRRPGLVVARLSAWGRTGPWGARRGFDSLVQAATGIAVVEGSAARPGVLPAQALDHGTGYLLAAAVLRALAAAAGGRLVELALARTAAWLMALPGGGGVAATGVGGQTLVDSEGVTRARPAVTVPGGPVDWPAAARPWGADPPEWTTSC
jgi:crotonobetainyl-CoA:carnitine CoA-transferase CaiB-like acyl-CoA transferase